MNYIIEKNKICQKNLVFISDLHFDFSQDSTKENGHRYAPEFSKKNQDTFISFVKENLSKDILLLGGDFYNNYKDTLEFVKEMEKNEILGFFVLGNHDYWNNGTLSHEQILSIFSNELKNNKFFKFLMSGLNYYIDDLCFIGDTGWTSFKRTVGKFTDNERARQVNLKQFMELPDAINVKDFSTKKIRSFHNEWIKSANQILVQEEKVIVLTHFPMFDLTEYDKDCWWSSKTELLNTENQWQIFGHTHSLNSSNYRLTCQRGYKNRVLREKSEELYQEIKNKIIERQVLYVMGKSVSKGRMPSENALLKANIADEKELNKRLEMEIKQYTLKDFFISIG